jgi:hypothetical protein
VDFEQLELAFQKSFILSDVNFRPSHLRELIEKIGMPLSRPKFLELLWFTSLKKFENESLLKNYDKVDLLFQNHLITLSDGLNWDEIRTNIFWQEPVNAMLFPYQA